MSTEEEAAASAPTWVQHVRGIAEDRVRWVDRVSVQLFVEDYDRLREQNFALNAALHAQCDSFEDPAALRADLSRALPVVEAAGAVVEHCWSSSIERDLVRSADGTMADLFDALARAVRAARGEQP